MEEKRNWLQMPDEIMGGMILQRLGAVEILSSAQKVCTTWRRICKDPAMWKIIDLDHSSHVSYSFNDFQKVSKQAVRRSCGELIHIRLNSFVTDDILDLISRSSSKLKSLRLMKCYCITGDGLIRALKRLPCLETLELFYISDEDIKAIGQSCPQLKSFKMKTRFMECDNDDALAIANSMPALRHLQLFCSWITGVGLRAILHGCPHLESLDIRRRPCLKLDGNLEKLCRERIKDFKFTCLSSPLEFSGSDSNDFCEECEFCASFPEDDFDNY